MCNSCQLVQLKDSAPPSEMYEQFYGYRSGINQTMQLHLQLFNKTVQQIVSLKSGDSVLDIGSNDCTFLRNYPEDVKKYGCDPTGPQFGEFYKNTNTTLVPTYFTKSAIHSSLGTDIRFKSITSISMFYDLPDPVQFAKDIFDILEDDGIWALEQSYVGTMLERNSLDTICHEHLEYYGVKQIKEIMDRSGFKIIDISLNECNGGSFRIFVAKKSSIYNECIDLIAYFLKQEEISEIHKVSRYQKFMSDCTEEVEKLVKFIEISKEDGKRTYLYGASTKGNCLLQFAKIDSNTVKYAVERNPLKVGRTTSTGIEIISEETMRENQPAYLLVLPWHFRDEIIKRESLFLENGGQLIFPFPKFEIYSSKPKTIITGINGQIGTHVEEILAFTDSIYGITLNNINKQTQSTRIYFDMRDTTYLEYIIKLIKPNRIVHLTSISNTEECENNPVKTLDTNGRLIVSICDILYKNRIECKLFNASSSELYKGHIEYDVKEDDNNMKPTTTYALCKMVGHRIVDNYRTKYGLPFSNGVIFMTESKLRKEPFLFKKVADHAKQYKNNKIALSLANLDSWRNINHAKDVASAIKIILDQPIGDTYLICSSNYGKMEDFVIDLYKRFNIILKREENALINIDDNSVVVSLTNNLRNSVTKITGSSTKLKNLGWNPQYDTQSILDDISDMS